MPQGYRLIANRAVRAEHLLTQLKSEDIRELSSDVSNLSQAVEEFASNRTETVLARAAYEVFGGTVSQEDKSDPSMEQLKALKRQGVEDPDIDLFLAVNENDTEGARKALDAGAHVNVTIGEILNRYRDRLDAGTQAETG